MPRCSGVVARKDDNSRCDCILPWEWEQNVVIWAVLRDEQMSNKVRVEWFAPTSDVWQHKVFRISRKRNPSDMCIWMVWELQFSLFFLFFFFRRFVEFFLTVGICFEDAELVDNLEQQSLEALREMMDIGKHFHTWHFFTFSIRKTLLG